jgi:hypothetical protein
MFHCLQCGPHIAHLLGTSSPLLGIRADRHRCQSLESLTKLVGLAVSKMTVTFHGFSPALLLTCDVALYLMDFSTKHGDLTVLMLHKLKVKINRSRTGCKRLPMMFVGWQLCSIGLPPWSRPYSPQQMWHFIGLR